MPVELVLADGTVHPQKGRLDAIERAVDATTGTLTLQFKFPNPDGLIRPGQYGRARFVLETKKGAMLVPQRAVQELQNLYNVAVVGSRQQARDQDGHRRPARGNAVGRRERTRAGRPRRR